MALTNTALKRIRLRRTALAPGREVDYVKKIWYWELYIFILCYILLQYLKIASGRSRQASLRRAYSLTPSRFFFAQNKGSIQCIYAM